MIQFSHVYKTYPGPNHALKNISLLISKGELVFITGPSGAGKTTLFRMISAYDKPTSGSVTVAQKNSHNHAEEVLIEAPIECLPDSGLKIEPSEM